MSAPPSWLLWAEDALLFALIGFNILSAWRNRQVKKLLDGLRAEIETFNRDKAAIFVQALEECAEGICPMCAIAAGHAQGTWEDRPMTVDAEVEGNHICHTEAHGDVTVPCKAAKARFDARQVMDEQAAKLVEQAEVKK